MTVWQWKGLNAPALTDITKKYSTMWRGGVRYYLPTYLRKRSTVLGINTGIIIIKSDRWHGVWSNGRYRLKLTPPAWRARRRRSVDRLGDACMSYQEPSVVLVAFWLLLSASDNGGDGVWDQVGIHLRNYAPAHPPRQRGTGCWFLLVLDRKFVSVGGNDVLEVCCCLEQTYHYIFQNQEGRRTVNITRRHGEK